jgi:hypothetical protein
MRQHVSDPSVPLTTLEYEEWGNPAVKHEHDLNSHPPYDNVFYELRRACQTGRAASRMIWSPAIRNVLGAEGAVSQYTEIGFLIAHELCGEQLIPQTADEGLVPALSRGAPLGAPAGRPPRHAHRYRRAV